MAPLPGGGGRPGLAASARVPSDLADGGDARLVMRLRHHEHPARLGTGSSRRTDGRVRVYLPLRSSGDAAAGLRRESATLHTRPGVAMVLKSRSMLRCVLGVLAAAATLATAWAAQAAPAQERVVVTFKPGAVSAARAAVAAAGGRVVVDLADLGALAVRLPANAVAELRRDGRIASVEADPLRRLMAHPGRSASPLAAAGETVPYGIGMVQADQLGFAAASAPRVCIIDSGYDLTHEDLQKSRVGGVNLTGVGDWNTDENSHGTHMAGTIAALGGNGVGVVGVVPGGTLPLTIAKVFDASGTAPSSAILKGVRQCARAGARIINMSLGGGAPTRFEASVYQRMADRGILVIAAAGNGGDGAVSYPAGYPSVMSVAAVDANGARAGFSQFNADVEIAAPGVGTLSTVPPFLASLGRLTVGASAYAVQPLEGSPRLGVTAPLADFGLGLAAAPGTMTGKVCLIARGQADFSTKVLNCEASGGVGAVVYNNTAGPLLGTLGGVATAIPSVGATQADGAQMLTQLGATATVSVEPDPALYGELSGTSMATPHVAGVAALVWSNHPACTGAQIRSTLQKSALDLGAAGRDDEFGFGLVQARAASDRIASLGCGN
jgi:hypothetical protein